MPIFVIADQPGRLLHKQMLVKVTLRPDGSEIAQSGTKPTFAASVSAAAYWRVPAAEQTVAEVSTAAFFCHILSNLDTVASSCAIIACRLLVCSSFILRNLQLRKYPLPALSQLHTFEAVCRRMSSLRPLMSFA